MKVEVPTCPKCSTPGLQTTETGQLVCTGCGSRFVAASRNPDSLFPCPECAFSNHSDANSCAECGAPLAKYCARCGARLELRMRFCDQCGASYQGLSAPDGRCHWCGCQNQRDAELCQECGARLIMACPQCDSRMRAGLRFCRTCGLEYETLLEPEEEEET
jgi:DNA-directed RNA polymerase subunit RPC12/RpoP